ncbi:MAG: hypothetical protein ABJH05_05525 [Fulvivirga sp.]
MKVRRAVIFMFFILNIKVLYGQKTQKPVQDRIIQLSIVPSLGINGLHPGSFNNYISINLTSGYSLSSLFFELSTFSNLNTNNTQGLQIAGLVNITGGNAFAGLNEKEIKEKILSGFSPNLTGIQLSGISNIVLGNIIGSQITGGLNLGKGALIGFQSAGIGNIVYKYGLGVQLAGLFNVSMQAFDGLQVATISNYTKGNMAGVQIAALNQAGDIFGVNSNDNSQPVGLQIGLVNIAKSMSGFQIGLINISKRSRGTQIGLINFYRGGKQPETKDGTAFGLINIGDITYVNIYANELYGLNYELSTGNRKNGRMLRDKKNIYITNSLSYSHKSFKGNHKSIGYGLKRMYFNRSPIPGQTESKFLSYGIDVQLIKLPNEKILENLNILSKVKFAAGSRIAPKLVGFNWFLELSLNGYITQGFSSIRPGFLSSEQHYKSYRIEYWPGVAIGFLMH